MRLWEFHEDGRLGPREEQSVVHLWEQGSGAEEAELQGQPGMVDALIVISKAERDLEELNARERRISSRTQQLVAMEAQRALDAGFHSRAMRLCLAGEPTAAELSRAVKPERALRAVWAAAAQSSPCLLALPHPRGVNQLRLASNETRIITAGHDHVVRVWDAVSGQLVAELPHDKLVMAIAVDESTCLIATASRDRIARLWDVNNGKAPLVLPHADEVTSIAFSQPRSNSCRLRLLQQRGHPLVSTRPAVRDGCDVHAFISRDLRQPHIILPPAVGAVA